jgi:hypothetical protein
MSYGSPNVGPYDYPRGDPGIELSRIHREEMLRRNGVDAFKASGTRSEVRLPFERAVKVLVWILIVCFAVAKALTHSRFHAVLP